MKIVDNIQQIIDINMSRIDNMMSQMNVQKIKEEADLPVSEQDFENMCDIAWKVPYGFLMIDFSPKEENKRFRSGFDEYLIPPSLNK